MDQSLLSLPLISTFIFWLVGVLGNWRRTIIIFVLSYAAVILAYQHYEAFGGILVDTFGFHLQAYQAVALGFSSCLVLSLTGLYILYNVLWKPTSGSQNQSGGGARLLMSVITGIIGWALGVLLAASYIQIQDVSALLSQSNMASTPNIVVVTANILNTIVHPWLVNDPPGYLTLLGLR